MIDSEEVVNVREQLKFAYEEEAMERTSTGEEKPETIIFSNLSFIHFSIY